VTPTKSPVTLKIGYLIAQYLYQNKQLDLQGVGSFRLDPAVYIPTESDKTQKGLLEGVTFEYNPRAEEDAGLVTYIVKTSGKIRPLASSDLDSFIMLGKQFLNIGKPFIIEGVGTLVKSREGNYEFEPGNPLPQRLEEVPSEKTASSNRPNADDPYTWASRADTAASSRGLGIPVQKVMIIAGILIGLVALGWGGYALYEKLSSKKTSTVNSDAVPVNNQPAGDTITQSVNPNPVPPKDSLVKAPVLPPAANGMISYRVVFETFNDKAKALNRYKRLKEFKALFEMYTTDSVTFKFYANVSSFPADTLRKKDSVSKYFTKPPRPVAVIEY
jgi:hypothetical protein